MSNDKRRRIEGIVFLIAFGLTIPAANWLIGNVGTVCAPNGPCLIPVAPGLMAPSGVLMIGVALVLRDLVQRRLGVGYSAGAGGRRRAILSALLAPPALVIASAWRSCFRSSPTSRSIRRSRAADSSPPWWRRASSASSSIPSCSCGSPSARSISCRARSSARPGWCCCRSRSCYVLRRRDERLGLTPA